MKSRAFTLIELLVVISIIGLLSSIVMASLNSAREKGRIAAGRQFSANVYHAAGDYAMGSWEFDECGGTVAADSTGNGGNGVVTGSPVWSSDTPSGKGCSLSLNGAVQFVGSIFGAALPTGSSPLSMFAWMKTTTTARQTILSYGNSATAQAATIDVNQISSNGDFFVDFYSTVVDSGVSVNDGRWHYIGFSIAGGSTSVNMYVDGQLVKTATAGNTPNIGAGTNAQIGRWVTAGAGDTGPYYFNGLVDEARIYAKTLTARDVGEIYAREAPRFGLADR